MPHVTVKLWPGKSEAQKRRLSDEITAGVMQTLDYIRDRWSSLYKKPGYRM